MCNLNVAIYGCGRMGRQRAAAAAEWGAAITAVYDPDRERAALLAEGYPGCRILAQPDHLDWSTAQAVFICTPPFTRGPIEDAALHHHTPVFVEKPIGLTAQNFARLLADYPDNHLTAVGYMNRYRPSVQQARNALAGKIVLGAVCHWAGGRYEVPWWACPEQSGGPINEQATHLLDLARYLLGDIAAVRATTPHAPGELVETAAWVLTFSNGVLCPVFYSCLANTKMIGFHVFTPNGEIQLDGWDFHLCSFEQISPPLLSDPDRYAIFRHETAAFLDAIVSSEPQKILCSFRDALHTQIAVDALHRALVSDQTETIGDQTILSRIA